MQTNSKEYWESRFSSDNWEKNEGVEQSNFFYTILKDLLPEWIKKNINKEKMSICDIGCAEGSGTHIIKQAFPQSQVCGIDISESAVKKAEANYPDCAFLCDDVNCLKGQYDVVLSSNTFEHFSNPIQILRNVITHSKKYLIILVPLNEENRIEEHMYTFHTSSFPSRIEDYFLVFHKEIDCRTFDKRYWPGDQILVIYAQKEILSNLTLADMDNGFYANLYDHFTALQTIKNEMIKKIGYLYTENIQINDDHQLLQYCGDMINKFVNDIHNNSDLNKTFQQIQRELIEVKGYIQHKSQEIGILQNTSDMVENQTNFLPQIDMMVLKYQELNSQNQELEVERNTLNSQNQELAVECDNLKFDKNKLMNERDVIALEYETVLNSTCWKMTNPLRLMLNALKKVNQQLTNALRELKKLVGKTIQNIKTYGLKKTISKIFMKGGECLSNVKESGEIAEQVQNSDVWEQISRWIDETPHEFIDIFHVPMGWNTPLFQRFQHLSLQAGAAGGISFYGAHPLVDKNIKICEFVTPTLCVVNLDNYEVKRKLFEILDTKSGLKFIRLQSIDLATTIEELQSFLARGYEIVYEYIDELTPQIVGNIPKFVLERHEYVLRDERISVVATSDKLFEQVKPYRNHNMEMINNGVDYAHWNIERNKIDCPEDLKEIVNQGKIIIGYHGALAQWIDYDLLKKLAQDSRFILLLIGYAHDDHLKESGLLSYDNVYFIGPRPYSELSQYAAFYDIAILPFLLNDITKSVSPVKIFEYMALEKPVVTYALPECLKYQSCLCADTQEEFLDKINKALDLRFDKKYLTLLKKEALDNTWQSIMKKTVELVETNHRTRLLVDVQPAMPLQQARTAPAENQNFLQEKGFYRTLKKIFWKLPFLSPRAKENFLFGMKRFFRPSLLQYPPQETAHEHQEVPQPQSTDNGSVLTASYISQILSIPDKSQEYVPITEKPYKLENGDCKVIAYYLTQFHPDHHNEEWWGRGVTEWNNVCRAVPQFVGHYQPRLPGELGFYDLRIRDNMARQIELAKMYGVYGFSFYYYWFNGERLLEKPLEAFLADKTLDFPFSLCWANENWTKRFDGTNFDVLMEQPKTVESYQNVIHDMERFLTDERYITVKGKKLITVYRPDQMPEPQKVLTYWREYCRKQGIGELYLVAVKVNMVGINLLSLGYDAITEFHPGTIYTNCKNVTQKIDYIRSDFGGEVFDYRDIVENQKYFKYNLPKLYRAVMPMWDNTARRNNKGMIFQGSTPLLYKQWLKDVITEEKSQTDLDDKMVFINAWNEWGEGAYLEPDKRFGYAYLEATREAVEETRNEEDAL